MEVKTKARKWGNSIAIILPKMVVDSKNIQEDDEVIVTIEKSKPRAEEFFGRFPQWKKKSTQKIKDEMKRGW